MLPEDATYRLRWESSPSLLSEAPHESAISLSDPLLLLSKGISKLDVSIFELPDGHLRLRFENSGNTTEVDVKGPVGIFKGHGFLHQLAGVKQTKSGDPTTPFLLACLREYAAEGIPSPGFRVWLELAPSPGPNVVLPVPLSK